MNFTIENLGFESNFIFLVIREDLHEYHLKRNETCVRGKDKMSEFENTMELSINPYDDLIERPEEAVVSPVILNEPGRKETELQAGRPIEIVPLASDVIYTSTEMRELAVLWNGDVEVEEDLLVPDTEADMESVLNTSVRVASLSVHEAEGGSCEVRGSLKLETMYRSVGVYNNVLSFIGAEVPFRKNCGGAAEVPAADITAFAEVKKKEIHVINERKYRVKLQLTLILKAIRQKDRKWFDGVQGEDLYLKRETLKFADIISRKFRDSEISEELLINNEKIRPLKILKSSFTIAENHRKLTKEKLIVNETIWVRIIYMAEIASRGNLSGQPMLFLGKIDHTQFFTLGKNESEAAVCTVHPHADDLKVEINDAATGFRVRGDVISDIALYSFREHSIVTDFYHGSEEMTCDMKEETVCTGLECVCSEHTVRESISLHENGGDDLRLIYLDAAVTESSTEVTPQGIMVRGKLQLEAVTMNEGDYTVLARKTCDFTCMADLPGGENMITGNHVQSSAHGNCGDLSITAEAGSVFVRQMSGDISGGNMINISAQIQVQLTVHVERRVGVISNPCIIRGCADEDVYPLTVYTVKENETVWDIAKRFRVAEENIIEINNAEDIRPGKKIVVVK